MPNSVAPYGLQACMTSDGGLLRVNRYWAPASLASLGIGTPVNIGGSANTANTTNGQETPAGTMPTIVVATSGDGNKLLGAIIGFEFDPNELQQAGYNPASTGRIVYVADHPMQKFTIIDDGTALAVTDIGLNANVTVGTVNAFTGLDSSTLDTSTPNTNATYQLKILSLYNAPDNVIGTANAQYVVQINNHIFGNIVAGV